MNYTPTTAPVRAFRAAVRHGVENTRVRPTLGPLCMAMRFVLARPQSGDHGWRKTQQMPSQWDTRHKGDIDNYAKAVMDCLHGVLFEDDSQVVGLWTAKLMVGTKHSEPGVEVGWWVPRGDEPTIANPKQWRSVMRDLEEGCNA